MWTLLNSPYGRRSVNEAFHRVRLWFWACRRLRRWPGTDGCPEQSLAKVGLGGMAMLSDPQGLEIRGLGVSEGTYGDQGDHGEKDHHQKGEKYKHHENKQHEHKHPECHDHQHEKCGQSVCHVSSLCHVECTAYSLSGHTLVRLCRPRGAEPFLFQPCRGKGREARRSFAAQPDRSSPIVRKRITVQLDLGLHDQSGRKGGATGPKRLRGHLLLERATVDQADFLHHPDPSGLLLFARHDDSERPREFFQRLSVARVGQHHHAVGKTGSNSGSANITR